jgi:hypothetical protein
MSSRDKDVAADIADLSIEEKIKLLSASEKDYLRGYMDHALEAGNKRKRKPQPAPLKE